MRQNRTKALKRAWTRIPERQGRGALPVHLNRAGHLPKRVFADGTIVAEALGHMRELVSLDSVARDMLQSRVELA